MNIAALNVKIGADLADFNKGIDAVGAKFSQIGANLKASASNLSSSVDKSFRAISESAKTNINKANSSLNNLANKFDETKNNLSGITRAGEGMQSIGTGLTVGLTVPIVALGAASLKTFGDIQALKLGLEAVTGSSEEAGIQFERLRKVAKLPGLGLNEAVKGSINLQTIGFSADKAEQSLQVFGNAVATVGKGRVEFERAIYGLQQLANTEFPLGEDLNIIKDAIPQITPLLKQAFGTARSDELKKLGITSQQVVDTILTGLAKLPPVAGGINNAFENMGDSMRNALGSIGEDLNRAFNIEGIVTKIADTVEKLVNAFIALPTPIKNTVYIIAGLAAAIGPLLLAFGTILVAIPSITAGFAILQTSLAGVGVSFAAITGPIGIAIAAIAAAGIVIYKNWDRIKKYFQDTGFLDKVSALFDAVMNRISAIVNATVGIVTGLWKRFGDNIMSVVDIFTNHIGIVFGYVFDQVLNALDLFTNIFNGNWKGVWDTALKIVFTFTNFVLDAVSNMVTGTLSLLSGMASALGGDAIAKGLDTAATYIEKFVSGLKVEFPEAGTGEFNKSVSDGLKEATKTVEDNTKKINEELNKIGVGVLADVNTQLEIATEKSIAFGNSFDVVKEKLKVLESGISSLIEAGFSATSGFVERLQSAIDSLIGRNKIVVPVEFQAVNTDLNGMFAKDFKFEGLKIEGTGLESLIEVNKQLEIASQKSLAFGDSFDAVGAKTNILQSAISSLTERFGAGSGAVEVLKQMLASLGVSLEGVAVTAIDVGAILKSALTGALNSFAQTLGNLISGNAVGSVFDNILSIVADFVGDFGKALIAAGVASEAFKKLLNNPYAAIAAGVALVAISTAIKGSLSSGPVAGGGASYSSAGGGAGMSTQSSQGYNPAFNQFATNQDRELTATIKGTDLLFVVKEAQRKEDRVG